MSRSVVLFDDDHFQCTSHLHSRKIFVCATPRCHVNPVVCCGDCVQSLHRHDECEEGPNILSKNEFVVTMNRVYQETQEQAYALEGELQQFERKAQQSRRIFNGEIERLRLQLNKLVDLLKDSTNKLFDKIILNSKKTVASKVQRVKDGVLQFKPISISKTSNDLLRKMIGNILHADYQLERDKLKNFIPQFQESLKQKMFSVYEQTCLSLSESSSDLIQDASTMMETYDSQDAPETEGADQLEKLLRERENVKNQMEQHILSKNCTHKGCHQVTAVKAYYGYYYHRSGYAVFGELPISVCAYSKKLAQKMDKIVNQLYALQHRDSKVDDNVQAYFIY